MHARPLAWFAPLVVTLAASLARADAIAPPPDHCPPGQVPVTSHAGPACVREAPKDCPPGWIGERGGTCTLALCTPGSADACEEGAECVTASLCLEPFEDEYFDYGETSRAEAPPAWLAAPPLPRKKRPSPIVRWSAVDVCAAGAACDAPRACRPYGVCVARGKTPARSDGRHEVTGARTAIKTQPTAADAGRSDAAPPVWPDSTTPPTQSASAPAPAETSAPPPPVAGRGCAGCAEAPREGGSAGWTLVAAGAALVGIGRRRRVR